MMMQMSEERSASQTDITADDSVAGHSTITQLVKAESGSTIQDVVQQVFVGDYERLRDAYINPWPVFERVSLDHFVGREWLLAEVDAFLRDHDRGYFILEAEAGLGKTTFLAWLVRERGYIHHFVELAPGLDGVGRGLKNLAAQLVLAYQLSAYEAEGVLPGAATRPDFLQRLLRQAADQRQDGEKIVLVVDALDEAGTPLNQNVLGLPLVLPEGVFVIVSQRPVVVTLQVDTATTTRLCFSLAADSDNNRDDMRRFLQRAATWPGIAQALQEGGYTPEQFTTSLLEKCGGVWIYLHYVIHEIERGERSPLDLDTLPDGMTQYYARYWGRLRDEDEGEWYEVYLPVLATLAAAQEAVTAERLIEWADVKLPERRLRRLLNERWRPFLTIAGQGQNARYRFYHATLREFFNGQVDREKLTTAESAFLNELVRATREAHRRIANWYLAVWGGLDGDLPYLQMAEEDAVLNYGLRHVPFHLSQSGQAALLYQLVKSPAWAAAKPLTTPKAIWYLDDLTLAFETAIPDEPHSIVDAMGYALKRGLVQRQIANPRPEAVVFLAELDEFDWALELARVRPLRKRVEILERIGLSLGERAPERALLALEELAHTADDSDSLLDQCVCRCLAAQRIAQLKLSSTRSQALADEAQTLASFLSASERASYQVDWELPTMAVTGRLEEALSLAEGLPILGHCRTLRKIANALPSDHPEKPVLAQHALELAQAISGERRALEQRVCCLITLAESQTGKVRQQTIDELVCTLDELGARVSNAHVIQSYAVERLAKLDLSRARLYMEQERWPGAINAWDAIVSETAKVDTDRALDLLNERLATWAIYPYVLVDIIEQVALKDVDRAENLIRANAKRLERNLDSAYLALAKGHLIQGNRDQVVQIFYQPAFFVNEEHNVHDQAEMQLAMFGNAASFISLEAARDWFGRFPVCSYCGRNDERNKARQVLIQVAAYHDEYDLLEECARSEEDWQVAAIALARKGSITKAREYINQYHLRTDTKYGARAYAYIAESEARHDPTALDELIGHYESDPPHHFCHTMMELPWILHRLAQVDPPPAIAIDDIIERLWASIIHWQCPRDTESGARQALGGQCACNDKREQVLGQLVGTMARVNKDRARDMLEALPGSPAQVYALTHIAQLGQVDEMFLARAKSVIFASFQDPYERAEAYYELAAALPRKMSGSAKELIAEAETWLNESPIYPQTDVGLSVRYGISASALKELKARVLIGLIQQPSDQDQIDEVLSIVNGLGAFSNKHAIFAILFQQAEKWPAEAKIDLLRHVLKTMVDNGLTGIQAIIAAAVPIIRSLGGDGFLELLKHVDWAYQ
jgi:hypothetical protein